MPYCMRIGVRLLKLSVPRSFDPVNKPTLDVLNIKERRVDAARIREATAMSNLTNFSIVDNGAV